MDRNYKCAFFYFFEAIVALRKESVDRNALDGWDDAAAGVALRKESVDRNENAAYIMALQGGRSPQGERG